MSGADGLTVEIQALPEGEGLPLPSYMTDGAAGCDLRAALSEPLTLEPGGRALVPAGFSMALPQGFEAQIRPRSGLAVDHGIGCLNAPGTIDADYRGPVCVLLINLGGEPFVIRRGDRIAQMIISKVERVAFQRTSALGATARGGGGFGSTGKL